MGIAITYVIENLAVLGIFFYVTYVMSDGTRSARKKLNGHIHILEIGNAILSMHIVEPAFNSLDGFDPIA